MGLMDKAKQAVQGRSRKIEEGVDKATTEIDRRTGGKYRDRLAKGSDTVKSRAREMDDDRQSRPGQPGRDERPS